MPPRLDPRDLRDGPWKHRPLVHTPYFRLPRRSRRATYVCWTVLALALYFTLNSATRWPHGRGPANPYDGGRDIPIQYSHLYPSLAKVSAGGNRAWNRNVLFAAGSLDAASKLAAIACEMSMYGRTNVHFALVGDNDMEMGYFRKLNGISEDSSECKATFHDARADFADRMTVERKQLVVRTALRHMRDFMHFQVLLVLAEQEAGWFGNATVDTAKRMKIPTIEVPGNAAEDLRWITRLDSGSLSAWHKPTFEIVIHADKHSGNLERLLRSLESAFYPSAHHRPKSLTVILDPSVPLHAFTKSFLSSYSFPSPTRTFIRRPLAVPSNPGETAKQYIESFYPVNDDTSLLILESNAELSKWYFHYLLFTTLEYKYSASQHHDTTSLFGISLEEPPSYLNGSTPFHVPPSKSEEPSPFLYPVPNTRAALFFAKHWSEFHSYFSYTLRHPPKPSTTAHGNTTTHPPLPPPLPSSEATNSWASPIQALIRARGYMMLYPAFGYESLAIVHREEPSHTRSSPKSKRDPAVVVEKPLMEKNNLLDSLPDGDLPVYINQLPLLDWWGRPALWDWIELDSLNFKTSISNCGEVKGVVSDFEDLENPLCDEVGETKR